MQCIFIHGGICQEFSTKLKPFVKKIKNKRKGLSVVKKKDLDFIRKKQSKQIDDIENRPFVLRKRIRND